MTALGALFTLLLRYHVIQQLVAQLILACSIYASHSWPIKQVSEVPQLFPNTSTCHTKPLTDLSE